MPWSRYFSSIDILAGGFDPRYYGVYNTDTRKSIREEVYTQLTVTYNVNMLEQPSLKESADRKIEDKINESVHDFKPNIIICIISADKDFVRIMQNVQRERVKAVLLAPAMQPGVQPLKKHADVFGDWDKLQLKSFEAEVDALQQQRTRQGVAAPAENAALRAQLEAQEQAAAEAKAQAEAENATLRVQLEAQEQPPSW